MGRDDGVLHVATVRMGWRRCVREAHMLACVHVGCMAMEWTTCSCAQDEACGRLPSVADARAVAD
eukprot:11103645-Prorocentrum_lima.AAC.1